MVVGAPHMTSQPVSSIFFSCSSLPSRTLRTPSLSIPWCCLPTSSSVCFVFFPLSLCLARWLWLGLINARHDHTMVRRSSCNQNACATSLGNSKTLPCRLSTLLREMSPSQKENRNWFAYTKKFHNFKAEFEEKKGSTDVVLWDKSLNCLAILLDWSSTNVGCSQHRFHRSTSEQTDRGRERETRERQRQTDRKTERLSKHIRWVCHSLSPITEFH